MHIKQVIIDGFKSYANRTVIDGWDSQFNAITGLNGSGKSNILDAICFVLGITNLSQVRALDLKDLVYKQGQARVTKATVTIVFDNSNRDASPMGFEDSPEITITRQIVIGGRNKYMINGQTAQVNRVQNLFHSVQLNVNNPHFLIMQGRITKVCNMKPHELLSMIEEATGTRMYESKRASSLQILEKKQVKMDEINKILVEELMGTMDSLREEKSRYIRWQSFTARIERLTRFTTAAEYTQFKQNIEECVERIESTANEISDKEENLINCIDGGKKLNHLLRDIDEEINQNRAVTEAEDLLNVKKLDLQRGSAALQALSKSVIQEEASLARSKGQMDKCKDKIASLNKDKAELEKIVQKASSAFTECQEKVDSIQSSLVGVGLDKGQGGGTLHNQLMEAQRQLASVDGQLQVSQMRLGVLRREVNDMKGKTGKEQQQFQMVEKDVLGKKADLSQKQAALDAHVRKTCASMGLSVSSTDGGLSALGARKSEIQNQCNSLEREFHGMRDGIDRMQAQLGGRLRFNFQSWPGLHPESVKGVFARLIDVTTPEAAFALEIAAGGRLFNVVVDTSDTGKDLLAKGRLASRVTLIPLDKITSRPIPRNVLELAKRIAGDDVDSALSLVHFDESVRKAAEYVLGGVFICKDNATAEKITFNRDINTKSVTLAGDLFDPQGTLSGGSRPQNAGLLNQMQQLSQLEKNCREVENRLRKSQSELQSYEHLDALLSDVESARHNVQMSEARLGNTAYQRMVDMVNEKEKELNDVVAVIEEQTEQKRKLTAKCDDLSSTIKALEGGDKNKQKELEAELTSCKKKIPALRAALQDKEGAFERLCMQVTAQEEELEQLNQEILGATNTLQQLQSKIDDERNSLTDLTRACDNAEAKLAQAKEKANIDNQKANKLRQQLSELRKQSLELEAELKKLKATQVKLGAEKTDLNKGLQRLMRENKWISSEQAFFGQAGGDFDFAKQDPRQAAAELANLKAEEEQLGKMINRKVMAMFEKSEREYNELVSKRDIIMNDKANIERVIAQLDEKKKEALESTWKVVTEKFGDIFSTLLPGTNAKLQKHVNSTGMIVGLEMKVAFSGVWKESLSELSGGQRSLLALSLILALLLFKPAPMYILDEVDAALDLSHTQNIGAMLKKHFPMSQFIVVSLKEGMFNNANVLFRTKFVDGVSAVMCTKNNN